jgi:coproporphyrinogen III oxidase
MGVSLVFHPNNPKVPTTHMNVRCFIAQAPDKEPVWWFGGGFDLTPYYGVDEDCKHFHQTAKNALDPFGKELHPKFKKWCDEYFFLPHRGETRGVGGVFFDYIGKENKGLLDKHFEFATGLGQAFIDSYFPLVKEHYDEPYTDADRQFQLWRRGRYVEFNLLYDRGTKFGLETGGRTQSILMSLPPLVRWDEEYHPSNDSPEGALLAVLREPRDWV